MSATKCQFVTSADGTKIWAESAGDPTKPAVVFIHGFSCTGLHFSKQFSDPALLENLHLIRYDVRGHGQSDQPLDAEAYQSKRHAEDYKAVVDAFGAVKPFLAGWSLGGIIAADVAANYGIDTISGSILLGGMPYRSMHTQIVHPVVLSIIPGLISESAADFSKACQEFPISCVADDFHIPEETRLFWTGALAIQHPLVRAHSLARTQDETALLSAKDTFPFLVIHGDGDKHMYIDKLEAFMGDNFGNVEFHALKGVGHAVFYESPEFVNKTILEFVKKVHGGT